MAPFRPPMRAEKLYEGVITILSFYINFGAPPPTFVQLEKPSYAELRNALDLPFRTSLREPAEPTAFVVGLHVNGQFLSDVWLSLSPHCNVFIGVKGAGKTSMLECLRYVLGADVPQSRKDAVRDHLNTILGPAGRIRALLKRADGTKLLVERSVANPNFIVTFPDDRQEQFTRPEPLQFPAYILGWHEIEQAATDVNIRRLYLDTIVGRDEVRRLEEEADTLTKQIRQKHDITASKYGPFFWYPQTSGPARRIAARSATLVRWKSDRTEGTI